MTLPIPKRAWLAAYSRCWTVDTSPVTRTLMAPNNCHQFGWAVVWSADHKIFKEMGRAGQVYIHWFALPPPEEEKCEPSFSHILTLQVPSGVPSERDANVSRPLCMILGREGPTALSHVAVWWSEIPWHNIQTKTDIYWKRKIDCCPPCWEWQTLIHTLSNCEEDLNQQN